MKPLRKSEVGDAEFKGVTKLFYGEYPYKVKLKANNVDIDNEDNRELYNWFSYHGEPLKGEPDDERLQRIWNCRFVNSFTRHAYFTKKEYLLLFMKKFADRVVEVQGPVSKKHIKALEEVSQIRKSNYEQKAIRDRNYYVDYDAKLTFNPYTHTPNRTSFYSTPTDYVKQIQYISKLQNFCADIVGPDNCVRNYWNVYLKKQDIKEVAMYMKLKYPDAIKHVTEVIVIENLNNR